MSTVVLCSGLPGAGKTALSSLLVSRCNFVRVGTDPIRINASDQGKPIFGSELFTYRTYIQALKLARKLAMDGQIPIVDATFFLSKFRAVAFEELTENFELIGIEVITDPEIRNERILSRIASNDGVNSVEVANRIANRFEPWKPHEIRLLSSYLRVSGNGIWQILECVQKKELDLIRCILEAMECSSK